MAGEVIGFVDGLFSGLAQWFWASDGTLSDTIGRHRATVVWVVIGFPCFIVGWFDGPRIRPVGWCTGQPAVSSRGRATRGHDMSLQWRLKDVMTSIAILAIYLAAFRLVTQGPSDDPLTVWTQGVAIFLLFSHAISRHWAGRLTAGKEGASKATRPAEKLSGGGEMSGDEGIRLESPPTAPSDRARAVLPARSTRSSEWLPTRTRAVTNGISTCSDWSNEQVGRWRTHSMICDGRGPSSD